MIKKLFILLLLIGLLASPVFAADQWTKGDPLGSDNASDIDTIIQANNEALDRVLSNHRQGADLSYTSTTTISVAAGEIVCSNSTGTIRKWRTNTSATSVTFSNIDTGAEEASTTYYVYAVADTDATTFTIKISKSATSPTGGTYYEKLGSFYNDSGSDIVEASVYANNYVKMGDDGRLPAANSNVNIINSSHTGLYSAGYTDMNGGQWQSFDITLNSMSSIVVIGGCSFASSGTCENAYIQIVYGTTQIAEGQGATGTTSKVTLTGIAINVSAGTYTIKAQMKNATGVYPTSGEAYCAVYVIPE